MDSRPVARSFEFSFPEMETPEAANSTGLEIIRVTIDTTRVPDVVDTVELTTATYPYNSDLLLSLLALPQLLRGDKTDLMYFDHPVLRALPGPDDQVFLVVDNYGTSQDTNQENIQKFTPVPFAVETLAEGILSSARNHWELMAQGEDAGRYGARVRLALRAAEDELERFRNGKHGGHAPSTVAIRLASGHRDGAGYLFDITPPDGDQIDQAIDSNDTVVREAVRTVLQTRDDGLVSHWVDSVLGDPAIQGDVFDAFVAVPSRAAYDELVEHGWNCEHPGLVRAVGELSRKLPGVDTAQTVETIETWIAISDDPEYWAGALDGLVSVGNEKAIATLRELAGGTSDLSRLAASRLDEVAERGDGDA